MENPPPRLTGLTVIDLGQVYQRPYAAQLMVKTGANVTRSSPATASHYAPAKLSAAGLQ